MSGRRGKWVGPIYRRVAIAEAHDPRVLAFPPLEFRLWADARIGPQSAKLGLGRFSLGDVADVHGQPLADVRAAFTCVCAALGWTYDERARWLFVPEALIVAWDGSPDQMVGYRRQLDRRSPPVALLDAFDVNVARVTQRTTPPTTGETTPQSTRETSPRTTGCENSNSNSNTNADSGHRAFMDNVRANISGRAGTMTSIGTIAENVTIDARAPETSQSRDGGEG